jgi:hypothetical protein
MDNLSDEQKLVGSFVGDFGPYRINIMNVCCYNRCHGNAVEGFWTLCDNIYDCVFTTLDFHVILDGKFTSDQHNVGFEVLTAASMKMAVLWVVAPCSLVEVYHNVDISGYKKDNSVNTVRE